MSLLGNSTCTIALVDGVPVSEHGFATHYVPSRRIPTLLEQLASLDDPSFSQIDSLIEESYAEREQGESTSHFVGNLRVALDTAFGHNSVSQIVKSLDEIASGHQDTNVRKWATDTAHRLQQVSPTSLVVALTAIRRGKSLSLLEALQMELNFATAYCVSQTPLCFQYG